MKTASSVCVAAVWALVLFSSPAEAAPKKCTFVVHLTIGESIFYMDTAFQNAVQHLVKSSFPMIKGCYPPNQSGTSCFSYSTGRKVVKGCNIHLGFDCTIVKRAACSGMDPATAEGKSVPSMMSEAYVKSVTITKANGQVNSIPEPPEHSFIGVSEEKEEM